MSSLRVVGGDQAGYKIHVDCIQTSNIGSMYAGHKLLAIWKYPKASYDVLEQHLDTHFVPPLSPVRPRHVFETRGSLFSLTMGRFYLCSDRPGARAGFGKCVQGRTGSARLHLPFQRLQCPRCHQRGVDCAYPGRPARAHRLPLVIRGTVWPASCACSRDDRNA
jgi:hypothetical protein